MQQKNNLNSNYFSYAIYSVFLTALLFIVFGANGWGAAAENEQAIGKKNGYLIINRLKN